MIALLTCKVLSLLNGKTMGSHPCVRAGTGRVRRLRPGMVSRRKCKYYRTILKLRVLDTDAISWFQGSGSLSRVVTVLLCTWCTFFIFC